MAYRPRDLRLGRGAAWGHWATPVARGSWGAGLSRTARAPLRLRSRGGRRAASDRETSSDKENNLPFDPSILVTSESELREVVAEFAERRIAFAGAWQESTRLDAILDTVAATQTSSWSGAGVSQAAATVLVNQGFPQTHLHLVFAHPDAVAETPFTVTYYRRLLGMGNKVFGQLFPQLRRLEGIDHRVTLSAAATAELNALNGILSIIAQRGDLSPTDPERLVILAEGGAIDGDWRNQIGRVATWGAFEAIVASLDPGDLRDAHFKRGDVGRSVGSLTRAAREQLIDDRWKPYEIVVSGFRLRFGAQRINNQSISADITVARLDNTGQPAEVVAAGEVKGSTDRANAMERWRLASGNIGAMNQIRSGAAGRRPTTFYVGIVVTEGVVEGADRTTGMRALLQNSTLDAAFSIVKLLQPAEQQRFRDFFRPQVGLP